ncbi:30S ribosomal protein S6 [Candidatus Uhrbacteria bacterium]|nr:30S ribosomal protein S6 [Candidatus Uhrbacteria bacterium]
MIYEFLYIISSAFTDTEVDGIMENLAALVKDAGGEISRHEKVGKLTLAYPIRRQKHGTYVLLQATIPAEAVKKIDRTLRLEWGEKVLRHCITRRTPAEAGMAFEMASYVYPLSETGAPSILRRRPTPPASAPVIAAAPVAAAESLTAEELDKKLDEILEDSTLENL